MVPHRETPLCKKVWIAQIAVLEKLQIENDLQRPNDVAEWILHRTLLEKSYDDENGLWMVNFFFHYHFFHTFH